MKVVFGLDAADLKIDRCVLTVGNFDGLHRGHQQLLTQGALLAADARVPLVVVTFHPHPLAVLRPEHAPPILTTVPDRLDLLSRFDVDTTVVAESTPDFLALEAEQFVQLLIERFHPVHIVEGSNFGFGKGRRGTPEMLQSIGRRLGFGVCIIEPVRLEIQNEDRVPVSSSLIRSLLRDGKVHRAALCLARPYALTGTVESGAGRGKNLGFPTANLTEIAQLIPADGVYAASVLIDDGSPSARRPKRRFVAAVSIGTNPTFDGHERKVEAHLLDCAPEDAPAADAAVRIEFGTWLREQRKFSSPQELADQIARDVAAVHEHARLSSTKPFRGRELGDGEAPS